MNTQIQDKQDPCRTLPSIKANTIYHVHTTMGCWRGPAISILHAIRLSRKYGIKGHIYKIIDGTETIT